MYSRWYRDAARKLPSWILLTGILLVVVVFIAREIDKGEFNINIDETVHAVTGLYFADVLKDLPLTNLVQYTYNYYAQYPALGLILWPPLFHFVEGVTFSVLGRSVVSARLTILIFAIMGLVFYFKLVNTLQDKWAAALSTLLLALLPSVLFYEKAVMLEIPALALSIAAICFWVQYLACGKRWFLYSFALFFSLALLTKQHTIFLVIFCGLTIAASGKWKLILNWHALAVSALCFLLIAPFYALAFAVTWQTISDNIINRNEIHGHMSYYWRQLPGQLGMTVLVMSGIGIVTSNWWGSRERVIPMLLWILSCYVTMTAFAGKESRYIIYWLPAFAYFAAAPLTTKYRIPWSRPIQAGAILALIAIYAQPAWTHQRSYVSGYAPLAKYITETRESGVILYDAPLHGNFIFFLRAYDPARRFVVMRKALYAVNIMKSRGSRELLHTTSDIQGLIERYGIKSIVVSNNCPLEYEIQLKLRELLNTSKFRLLDGFPIESNTSMLRDCELLLYENLEPVRRSENSLRLEMLTTDRDIVVSLGELLGDD